MTTATVGYIVGALGLLATFAGTLSWLRLRQWEKHLRRTRIAIAYKNKVKLNRPLLDWLTWAESVEKDKGSTGHAVYKMGGTTVAVLKPLPRKHVQETTRTIKPNEQAAA